MWWQGELGFMHRKGEGGPEDYSEARKYYQLASDQGDTEAHIELGVLVV